MTTQRQSVVQNSEDGVPLALVGTGLLFEADLIEQGFKAPAQTSRQPSARERLLAIQRSSVRVKGRQSPKAEGKGSPRGPLRNRDLPDVIEQSQTVSDVKPISLIQVDAVNEMM